MLPSNITVNKLRCSNFVSGQNESGIFPCPRGFYCPAGTGNDWRPCPLGTYSNRILLREERECTPCDAGKYCNEWNSTSFSGDCAAGYYCVLGSHTATPQLTNLTHCPATFSHLSVGGKCPRGNYCPGGSKTHHGKRNVFILDENFHFYSINLRETKLNFRLFIQDII